MSKRQRLSLERFEYTKGDEYDYERDDTSFSSSNEEESDTIVLCNKSTQTQEDCTYEKRFSKLTVLKTKTDVLRLQQDLKKISVNGKRIIHGHHF